MATKWDECRLKSTMGDWGCTVCGRTNAAGNTECRVCGAANNYKLKVKKHDVDPYAFSKTFADRVKSLSTTVSTSPDADSSSHVNKSESNNSTLSMAVETTSKKPKEPWIKLIKVIFGEGPIGFGLGTGNHVVRLDEGGQALKSGKLQIGDALIRVGKESMVGKSFVDVASLIKAAKRPLQFTFFRGSHRSSSRSRPPRDQRKPMPLRLDVHHASDEGDASLLSQLLSNTSLAAELNRVHPRTGDSPAHRAASKGHVRVLDMLIDAGATVNETRS